MDSNLRWGKHPRNVAVDTTVARNITAHRDATGCSLLACTPRCQELGSRKTLHDLQKFNAIQYGSTKMSQKKKSRGVVILVSLGIIAITSKMLSILSLRKLQN